MGMMLTAIGTFLVMLLVGATANQAAQEFRGWTPWITKKLIERAVARLPENMKERLREEWTSFIDDTPGQIVQIVRAVGLSRAAATITTECTSAHSASRLQRLVSLLFGWVGGLTLLPLLLIQRSRLLRWGPWQWCRVMETQNDAVEALLKNLISGAVVLSWAQWQATFKVASVLVIQLFRQRRR